MARFDVSSTIDILLYVALAIVITLVVVVLYFVYQYWFFKKHGSEFAHPDYEELRDLDGNLVQQANTICSSGAGIRMDDAPTRPKLQLLRTASLPTKEELPTGRIAALLPRSESNPAPKSSSYLPTAPEDPSPRHHRTSTSPATDSDSSEKAASVHLMV